MKILFLNTYDKNGGGAAIAGHRILEGIRNHTGLSAQMLVNHKTSTPFYVIGPETDYQKLESILRNPVEKLALIPYPKREKVVFSSAIFHNYPLFKKIKDINPDIVQLNWITGGFFRLEQLEAIKKPIVWRLPDMWGFTGGCHYSGECDKYKTHCGNCPILSSGKQNDLSYNTFQRKQKVLNNLNLTVVCTTSWMKDCAEKSVLFSSKRIEIIPNGLDTSVFKPIDKLQSRNILNLPADKKLILFGALKSLEDERKGSKHLYKALQMLNKDVEFVVFGADKPEKPLETRFKTHYMGTLKDEIALALLYSACDVMVVPSIQESFGQTASESLACGTPIVAFGATGLLDIVDHKINGYLAQPYEAGDLAEGIKWILNLSEPEYAQISTNARDKAVENFDIRIIAKKYYDLYNELS